MYQLASGQAPRPIQAEAPAEFEWSRLWRAIVQRRKIFTIVAIGAFLAIAAYTLLVPSSYTTHVKLIAGNGNTSAVAEQTSTRRFRSSTRCWRRPAFRHRKPTPSSSKKSGRKSSR